MSMLKVFRDPPFLRLFLGSALFLALLVLISCRIAWRDVPSTELVGTYRRTPVMFLHVADLPARLVLRGNGTMALFNAQGEPVYNGAWSWDVKEGVLRSDSPRWDRQIRMRMTLGGPRLCMRISTASFIEDEPEHDEEVDFTKDPHS